MPYNQKMYTFSLLCLSENFKFEILIIVNRQIYFYQKS